MAVALAAVDAMAAPDVTDVVGTDMTVAADTSSPSAHSRDLTTRGIL